MSLSDYIATSVEYCGKLSDTKAPDDFSLCFEDSFISWGLSVFSIILGIGYMALASPSQYTYACARPLFLLTLVGAVAALTPYIIILTIATGNVAPVLKWNSAIMIITIPFIIFVICYERTKGNVSLFPVWTFWFLTVLYNSIKLRTVYRVKESVDAASDHLVKLFIVNLCLGIFNLLLHSFREIPTQLSRKAKDPKAYIAVDAAADDAMVKSEENVELEENTKMKYDRPEVDDHKPCPSEYCSFINYISFNWLTSIVWRGFRNPLVDRSLYQVPTAIQTKRIIDEFFVSWTGGKPCPKGTTSCKDNKSLVGSLFRFNWKTIAAAMVLKLLNDLLTFVPPMILKKLIYFSTFYNVLPSSYGIVWCLILLGSLILQTFCIQSYFDNAIATGLKFRVALVAAIYRKSLMLNNSGQKSSQLGQMINLMQVDAQKFQDIMTYANMIWSAPLQIILAMYLLYQELKVSTFVGISITILTLPINSWIMKRLQAHQRDIMSKTDKRVRKTDEVLNGIKVIKLYGWESSVTEQVESIRSDELNTMRQRVKYSVFMTFVWTCTPILVSLLSFACYTLFEDEALTSTKTFVSLTLFNILRFPLVMLPNMITQLIQARVSIKRIMGFLALPELDPNARSKAKEDDPAAIKIKDGIFSWDESDDKTPPTLTDINVEVPRGKLVAVVGAVGSGKSSLISAILGEMDKIKGDVELNGSVSYVPQVSWILNDTLKNNILFGASWDKCFYKEVVVNCALESDLQILPNGDATEIGEKGINLSGGQKQRVSLARAMYNKNEIYIFDDPLSAVDSHVGKHIFDKVLGPNGMINHKTRLLVTHKLSVLPEVDYVIVMKDGKVLEQGKYSELMELDGELHRLVSSYEPEQEPDVEESPDVVSENEGNDEFTDLPATDDIKTNVQRRKSLLARQESTCSIKGNNANSDDKLIEEEKVEKGKISWKVYKDYIKYMGVFYAVVTGISFVFQYGCMLGGSLWLAKWSDANDEAERIAKESNNTVTKDVDLAMYLGVYGAFSIGQAIFVLGYVMAMLYASLNASLQIHRLMFERILRVPMSFFDTTPLGRILNRFSKDMNTIDEALPMATRSFVNILGTVLFTIVIIATAIPIMLPVFVPITVLYILVQKLYVPTSRQLKRLESVSRSPIYNQFGETLLGLSSIRAYSKSDTFIRYNEGLVDDNVRSYYTNIISNRWLSCRLEIIGHMVIFFTALVATLKTGSINAAQAGLAISYAMSVTQALAWVVRMYSELEINVVSIERAKEYSELVTEKELTSDKPPPKEWPDKGQITYDAVSCRYREGLDLVLKKLNIEIKAGERIGIVGRTGAGKSSVTLTLFRILELAEGTITIDGLDISKIGLHELRKKLAIIPQDPVLFSDTVRRNLDPFDVYTDEEVWSALESASLKTFFVGQEKKLGFEVAEGGGNLSVGQRQLVCLARALLSDNKIIVMDEATAAVDIETDAIIQDAIRQTFVGRTILTIAHRLNTILDYDRILVLDKGMVAEFGSATELKKLQGIFHSMLLDAGLLQMVPDNN